MPVVEVRGGKNNPLRFEYDGEKDIKDLTDKDLFLVSICDMYIFNENENLVMKLNKLINCTINMDDRDNSSTIVANSCTFNFELFKFINSPNISDYKSFFKSNGSETISFKKENGYGGKKCKIILVAEIRNSYNEVTNILRYNFPNCSIRRKYSEELASNAVSTTNIIIDVDADENGNLFEMTF
jgi:hypothetical protein